MNFYGTSYYDKFWDADIPPMITYTHHRSEDNTLQSAGFDCNNKPYLHLWNWKDANGALT